MDKEFGRLVPVGGGDPIPLTEITLTVGRRSSCDICLDYANVSGMHAELTFRNGHWAVRDLGSSNGVKVNGEKVPARVLRPGDEIAIAGHKFKILYTLPDGVEAAIPSDETPESILGQSLMEKAGLTKPKGDPKKK